MFRVYFAAPRHGAARKSERNAETSDANESAGRGSFHLRTFRGTTAQLRSERHRIQPSGWGAGEVKEREGKGRDACRGLRRDEVPRNFGAGLHGTDERKFIGPAIS